MFVVMGNPALNKGISAPSLCSWRGLESLISDFPDVYHFNNWTGKFIALILCSVAHGKTFLGDILSLYAN